MSGKTKATIEKGLNKPYGRRSIKTRSFVITMLLTLGIGGTVLVVGFVLYLAGMFYEYSINAWNMANAEAVILEDSDVSGKCNEIMDLYDSFTDEERGDGQSEEYKSQFDPVIDDQFIAIKKRMHRLKERHGPLNAFIVAIDEDQNKMIYLIDSDPNEETFVQPGYWEIYTPKQIQIFVHGNKISRWAELLDLQDNVQATVTNIDPYGWRCTAASTLYTYGRYTVLICVDEKLDKLFDVSWVFLRQYIFVLLLVTIIASLIGMRLIYRHMVAPINRMAEAAREYGENKQKLDSSKKFFDDLNIESGDEIENLAQTMKGMEKDLAVYMDDLTKVTAEKERIATELTLASQIQESMLPETNHPFPERPEFDVFASMEPARDVGGDFFDYYLIDEDHLAVTIADVSGKGIPAALFMMASMILLESRMKEGMSPAETLKAVNEQICENDNQDMFVTVWLGILEISTGRITAANAGHEYPILIHEDGQAEMIRDKHGFVLGGLPGMKYTDYELQLRKGDKIFVYTDGVTEATSADKVMFGTDRLMEALNEVPAGQSPRKTMNHVHAAVDEFVGDEMQFDDLTMLCLEYRKG